MKEKYLSEPAHEFRRGQVTRLLPIDGDKYPVVDLQEIVKGASTPRGGKRIIGISSEWKPVREVD